MQELAGAYPASDIGAEAYRLFKEFRPTPGQAGAGRARRGTLHLERLRELAAEASLRCAMLGLGLRVRERDGRGAAISVYACGHIVGILQARTELQQLHIVSVRQGSEPCAELCCMHLETCQRVICFLLLQAGASKGGWLTRLRMPMLAEAWKGGKFQVEVQAQRV